jgi:hypothetical protein
VKFPRHFVLFTPLMLAAGLLVSVVSASAVDTHWTPTAPQLPGTPDRPVWSIAVSPAHPSTLLAATQGHGVLRSTDSGASWTSVIASVDSAWVVTFDAQQPLTAYAGTQTSGFYKSTDEGKTWAAQNTGLTNTDIRAIASAPGILVAGTAQGVFYSTDGASTWQSLGLSGLSIAAVGLLPKTNGVTIFAGADNGSGLGAYLAEAQDLSGTWAIARGGFPGDAIVAALAVGSAPSGGTAPPVLAGTSEGLFRSDDGGATWSTVGGLPSSDFNLALFNPANPDQIYVGSDADQGNGGLFRSLDRGASWSPLGTGLPPKPRVTAIGLQPLNPIEVLAATYNPTVDFAGLYKISDPAATVAGASPTAAVASPTVAASAPVRAPSVAAHVQRTAPIEYQPYAAVAAILLALIGFVVARRWLMRREDRRTYR